MPPWPIGPGPTREAMRESDASSFRPRRHSRVRIGSRQQSRPQTGLRLHVRSADIRPDRHGLLELDPLPDPIAVLRDEGDAAGFKDGPDRRATLSRPGSDPGAYWRVQQGAVSIRIPLPPAAAHPEDVRRLASSGCEMPPHPDRAL
jgi:hypothetical protein